MSASQRDGSDKRGRPKRGSPRIGRLLGVDVLVHWTFVLLILLVVWGSWAGGIGLVAAGLVWVAAVFGSVLLHELAHCVVARRRGAIVEDILLIPLGGISQLSKMPEAPADEFAISVVGPLTSIGIGLLAVLAGLLVGARLWPPTLFAGSWFRGSPGSTCFSALSICSRLCRWTVVGSCGRSWPDVTIAGTRRSSLLVRPGSSRS